MPTKKQLPHMEIRCCMMRVWQYSRENPALYGRRSSVLVCPACDMPSLAPCLHEEADTRVFAHATEADKRLKQENKQLCYWYCFISSGHTCGVTAMSGWTVGFAKIAG